MQTVHVTLQTGSLSDFPYYNPTTPILHVGMCWTVLEVASCEPSPVPSLFKIFDFSVFDCGHAWLGLFGLGLVYSHFDVCLFINGKAV
jgi:hypothetical protein